MKRQLIRMVLVVSLVVFGAAQVIHAATLEEAKDLGQKAAAYIKANGREKGLAELNNPNGQFSKGEIYVTVHDLKGAVLAFSPNPKLVGQNHFKVKDPTGKFFVQELIKMAKKGSGWVTYMWTNPATKKVQAKKSWVQRVEGTDIFTLCGIFQ